MNLQRQRNRFALYVLRSATSFLIALHSNVYRKPVGKRSAPLFSFFATAYFCGATSRVRTRIACCTVLRTSRAHLTLLFSILSSVKVDGDHFPSTSHSSSDPSGDQRAGRISWLFM